MTTYATPESLADQCKRTARRFLRQADVEFENGDLLQASEKAWGAASRCIKALGTVRGLPHRDHRELRQIAWHFTPEPAVLTCQTTNLTPETRPLNS